MTMQEITDFLDKKIEKDINEIIITFYEVRVKMGLSEQETDTFLEYCKTRLENLEYQVFFTGAKFVYKNANRTVFVSEKKNALEKKQIYATIKLIKNLKCGDKDEKSIYSNWCKWFFRK